jgi:general stress protein 26
MAKSIQDAKAIIEQQPICDLITIDESGMPAERAMFTPKVEDDFTVYFGTYINSNKIRQIKANQGVVAVWPTGNGFLSLKGKAEIVDDQKSRDRSWHPVFAKHFTGSADPTYIVVKVTPISLSYYESGTMESQSISLGW